MTGQAPPDLSEDDDRVRVLRRIDYLQRLPQRRTTVRELDRDLDLGRKTLQRLAKDLVDDNLLTTAEPDGSTGRGAKGHAYTLTRIGESVLHQVLE